MGWQNKNPTRADALNEAADEIQALHPGEVKASVEFLLGRAAAMEGKTNG